MRPWHWLCLVVLVFFMAALGVWFHGKCRSTLGRQTAWENQRIAGILGLSDLVLSTEARYIRHLALADYFSAFQDTPAGLDLFPSGSFFSSPWQNRKQSLEKPGAGET